MPCRRWAVEVRPRTSRQGGSVSVRVATVYWPVWRPPVRCVVDMVWNTGATAWQHYCNVHRVNCGSGYQSCLVPLCSSPLHAPRCHPLGFLVSGMCVTMLVSCGLVRATLSCRKKRAVLAAWGLTTSARTLRAQARAGKPTPPHLAQDKQACSVQVTRVEDTRHIEAASATRRYDNGGAQNHVAPRHARVPG